MKKTKDTKEEEKTVPVKLTAKEQKVVQEVTTELLKLLEIEGSFDIVFGEESIDVVLETKDTGMVIGYHGEILDSLSLILSLCIARKIERFVHVFVDVGDYKKNRIDYLQNLAAQTKEKALSEQREFALSNLRSWERRIVHLVLQDDQEVLTESVGEGKERTLIIKPR